jgi:hypothetical protein
MALERVHVSPLKKVYVVLEFLSDSEFSIIGIFESKSVAQNIVDGALSYRKMYERELIPSAPILNVEG